MNNFIFNLVTESVDSEYFYPTFYSRDDLIDYFGEDIGIDYNNQEEIRKYVGNWVKEHKFEVLENVLYDYDLDMSYAIKTSVYTLDDKYYRVYYLTSPYDPPELCEGPCEVKPIKETITITKYVECK